MGTKKILTTSYNQTLSQIKKRILEGQYNALKSVNIELISLYRDIGKIISDAKTKGDWGTL